MHCVTWHMPLGTECASFVGMSQYKKVLPIERQTTFLEHCADLLDAGVSIIQALNAIKAQFPVVSDVLLVHLSQGRPFSEAVSGCTPAFDPLVPFFLRFGERSGDLAGALRDARTFLTTRAELADGVRKKSVYPLIVLAAALLTLVLVSRFMLPMIAGLFSGNGMRVPLFIRCGILLGGNSSLIFIALCGGIGWRSRHELWRKVCSRSSYLRGLVRQVHLLRFLQYGAVLLRSGCSLQEMLTSQRSFTEDPVFEQYCLNISCAVSQGIPFSQAVVRALPAGPVIPVILRSAESSGDMARGLERSAALVEKTLYGHIERIVQWMGPVLTVCMGCVVALVLVVSFYPLTTMLLSLE